MVLVPAYRGLRVFFILRITKTRFMVDLLGVYIGIPELRDLLVLV